VVLIVVQGGGAESSGTHRKNEAVCTAAMQASRVGYVWAC